MIRFSFTPDQPWIGFTGYSTTHPTALAPVSADATCKPTMTVLDKHKAMWMDPVSADINALIDQDWTTYAQ
jgi:hypothetical protein